MVQNPFKIRISLNIFRLLKTGISLKLAQNSVGLLQADVGIKAAAQLSGKVRFAGRNFNFLSVGKQPYNKVLLRLH